MLQTGPKSPLTTPPHSPHSLDVHGLAHLLPEPSLCSCIHMCTIASGQLRASALLCSSEIHTALSTKGVYITHLVAKPALNYL